MHGILSKRCARLASWIVPDLRKTLRLSYYASSPVMGIARQPLSTLVTLAAFDSDKESIKLWSSLAFSLSLSLGDDDSDNLLLLVKGTALGAESLAGKLD